MRQQLILQREGRFLQEDGDQISVRNQGCSHRSLAKRKHGKGYRLLSIMIVLALLLYPARAFWGHSDDKDDDDAARVA